MEMCFSNDPFLLTQIERMQDLESIDVRQILMDMRQYRMGLIQATEQLRFSYLAIIEGAKRILSDSPDSGFDVSQFIQ